MKKLKIGVLSLGCPRNLTDSESILGRLAAKGYPLVDINKAEVAVINTCAFIEDAKKESIDALLDLIALKKEGRLKKIVVYGCLSQRYKDALRKELPQIDAFVGRAALDKGQERFPITPRHYAYLKICEGCVNNCSFCAIPRIKGRFTSLDTETVLSKVEEFNRQRLAELNIIGQDISAFGLDLYGKPQLAALLGKIVKKAKDINWLRLLYLSPERVSDELLGRINDEPKICKYIDLPIQHINGRILKLMRRNITGANIRKLIEKIRKKIPGVALRTSLIVGFPTETEKEFKELLAFIEEVNFERLGAFIYSREEGTAAYNFKPQVAQKTKIERLNAVMSLQRDISRRINERFFGRTLDVLIDEKENGRYLGRTQFDAPEVDGLVYVTGKNKLKPGDFVKVKIKDTLEYDLVGEAV